MSDPLTAEGLAAALHGANGDGSAESDDYRFPYIDMEHADVIDGGLSILCRWMVAHFDVTPKQESPAAVSSAATGLADPREASRE